MESEGGPVVVRGGPSLRSEVLRLVAKRDRKLGEEFLKALDEAAEKERSDAATNQRNNADSRLGGSQRLQLARRLVEDGEIQRALEFATPALNTVSPDSIFFLSALREKNAQLADGAFTNLLALAARDPNSDANTVSGLSSYLFTPFLYVTFEREGGSNQSRQRGPTPAPEVDPALRNNFLKVAFSILMQPVPAPDQDRSTSGRTGKYLLIKRLLPLFEQYAADLAPNLRTQMTALASYVPPDMQQGENRAVSVGIQPESSEGDPLQRMQERLDRATKSDDRDAIYADYAVSLSQDGDPRGKDLVDKIENTELRKSVKAYTDFQLVQAAVRNKDVAEIGRHLHDEDAPVAPRRKVGRLALIRVARLHGVVGADGDVDRLFRIAVEVAEREAERPVRVAVPTFEDGRDGLPGVTHRPEDRLSGRRQRRQGDQHSAGREDAPRRQQQHERRMEHRVSKVKDSNRGVYIKT